MLSSAREYAIHDTPRYLQPASWIYQIRGLRLECSERDPQSHVPIGSSPCWQTRESQQLEIITPIHFSTIIVVNKFIELLQNTSMRNHNLCSDFLHTATCFENERVINARRLNKVRAVLLLANCTYESNGQRWNSPSTSPSPQTTCTWYLPVATIVSLSISPIRIVFDAESTQICFLDRMSLIGYIPSYK